MGSTQKAHITRIVMSLIFMLGVIAAPTFVIATSGIARAAETYGGGSVSSYAADSAIENGAIVILTGDKSDRVKVATEADIDNMFGVVVDKITLPLTVSNEGVENETYVAVSGTYNVLVSNQAGAIKSGDYLTLSKVNGVAMKVDDEEVTVFGRANADFNDNSTILATTDLKDSNGDTQTVKIGSIPVTIDIKSNPNHPTTEVNAPDFLKRIGEQIAEKEVSPIRIYISIGIAIISLIAAFIVIYAGVRSGVISIGRNPIAKKSIFRALLEIILTAALILIIGLFAVYLILKL